MNDATMMTLDTMVEKLLDNELGVLLVTSRGTSLFDILTEQGTTWEDRLGMFGSGHHLTYHLFPLLYNKQKTSETPVDLSRSRMLAVQQLFARWTAAGYNKRRAKQPFGCKAFQGYLDELCKADYLLLMVE